MFLRRMLKKKNVKEESEKREELPKKILEKVEEVIEKMADVIPEMKNGEIIADERKTAALNKETSKVDSTVKKVVGTGLSEDAKKRLQGTEIVPKHASFQKIVKRGKSYRISEHKYKKKTEKANKLIGMGMKTRTVYVTS
jgi:hypothetical protein